MNLLIENLNSALLNKIDANVIKTLHGEFTKDELSKELVNFYYSKVIIDITAIKDYTNFNTLFDFLSYFEKDQVIILLDENTSKECISKLVQEGYYDFTRNVGGINYLTTHPNTLKDVEKYIIQNQFQNPLFNNNQMDSLLTDTSKSSDNLYKKNENQIVIGIQNLTPHAGATTLTYMFVKALKDKYNVEGIEMMSQDHIYLRDIPISESTSLEDLKQKMRTLKSKEVVVIDLNDIDGSAVCDYIIYLIEPGIVNLNKLLTSNKNYSRIFKEEKIVLNRSTVNNKDIPSFEYETGIKVFYNLKNIDERNDKIQEVNNLLIKLGFNKLESNKGLFSFLR